jgi:hypothetical protein
MEPLQFKLDPLQYPALQKRIITRLASLAAVLLVLISFLMLKGKDLVQIELILWAAYMVFLIVLYSFAMFRSLKKSKKVYESYMIIINEQGVKRIQDNLNDLYIPIDQITAIEKKTNGKFIIKGISNNPFEKISIPKQIENYQKVEELLTSIKPITLNVKTSLYEKYGLLVSIAIAMPLLGVYVLDNKIAISVCAAVSVTGLIYSFFSILKYRIAVKGLNRGVWTLLIVLISVIIATYFKLIA